MITGVGYLVLSLSHPTLPFSLKYNARGLLPTIILDPLTLELSDPKIPPPPPSLALASPIDSFKRSSLGSVKETSDVILDEKEQWNVGIGLVSNGSARVTGSSELDEGTDNALGAGAESFVKV